MRETGIESERRRLLHHAWLYYQLGCRMVRVQFQ